MGLTPSVQPELVEEVELAVRRAGTQIEQYLQKYIGKTVLLVEGSCNCGACGGFLGTVKVVAVIKPRKLAWYNKPEYWKFSVEIIRMDHKGSRKLEKPITECMGPNGLDINKEDLQRVFQVFSNIDMSQLPVSPFWQSDK